MDMGRKKNVGKSLALQTDASGHLRYDALLTQNLPDNRIVHSTVVALTAQTRSDDPSDEQAFARPDNDTVREQTERTQKALEKIVGGKVAATRSALVGGEDLEGGKGGASFIKYTPGQQGAGQGAVGTRIIRMVDGQYGGLRFSLGLMLYECSEFFSLADNGPSSPSLQPPLFSLLPPPLLINPTAKQDPLSPPRFKAKKVPKGPPSPPPPVMHSPPRKVTAEEQKEWYIPPSISSWKNRHGYTNHLLLLTHSHRKVPLDKRLASDGRGMQEVVVNDNFAKLSEAMFIADRHAREEVRLRAEMQSKVAAKEKREKEERLRALAQRAREERAGLKPGAASVVGADETPAGMTRADSPDGRGARGGSTPPRSGGNRGASSDVDSEGSGEDEVELSEEAKKRAKEREDIRRERQKMREREMRMSHMGQDAKKRFEERGEGRDISEKIALGIARPTAVSNTETLYDSRLFNRSAGMTSGFGEEDSYGLYDKPLFTGSSANIIYKAPRGGAGSKHDDEFGGMDMGEMEKLASSGPKPARGFQGTDVAPGAGGGGVAGPVLFEKDAGDVFGLEKFLEGKSTAKRAREDGQPQRGLMGASTAGKREDYDNRGSGRRMEFEPEGKRSRKD
ncbi:mRNA splicing protein [Gonapodya sp. JEL0774]|nr:mRNA splicing protein [Gonapodya sp. JEL0774]